MAKEWTGERLETFVFNETTIEHLHRYAIAMELAKGKKVLDIACGVGYGSNLLASVASHVTGVDINKATIITAQEKYKKNNLHFVEGDVEKIDFESSSFDLIVSFETIEHIENHEAMLLEFKRVLKGDGVIIISTPDKKNYSDKTGYKNQFHKKELYRHEFDTILKLRFKQVEIYDQLMTYSSFLYAPIPKRLNSYDGDYSTIKKNEFDEAQFLVAIASDTSLPEISSSIFSGKTLLEKLLIERERMVKNTITFKVGHLILYPFKVLKGLFKNKHTS